MKNIYLIQKALEKKKDSVKEFNNKGIFITDSYIFSMAFKNTYYNNMDSVNLIFNNFETRDAYN